MSRESRRPAHGRHPARLVETLTFKVIALVIAATVAILLWQFALRFVGYALGHAWPRETTSAVVAECDRTLGIDGACLVDFTDPAGRPNRAELTNPGLFAMSPGERVPVVVGDGTVGLGGWQPIVDSGVLLTLSLAFTGYAIGWWRRVLEHDNPLYDGGEPDPDPAWRNQDPPDPPCNPGG